MSRGLVALVTVLVSGSLAAQTPDLEECRYPQSNLFGNNVDGDPALYQCSGSPSMEIVTVDASEAFTIGEIQFGIRTLCVDDTQGPTWCSVYSKARIIIKSLRKARSGTFATGPWSRSPALPWRSSSCATRSRRSR